MIGFIVVMCLSVVLLLTVSVGCEMVQLPEQQTSDNIVPFTTNFAGVCERMQTEVNETLLNTTVVALVVTSFDVVSDDCLFEKKQYGLEEGIIGAPNQSGSAKFCFTTSGRTVRAWRMRRSSRRTSFET